MISIHAPTRGATAEDAEKLGGNLPISIHAPTRGATSIIALTVFTHFISIHAPTRGATILCYILLSN